LEPFAIVGPSDAVKATCSCTSLSGSRETRLVNVIEPNELMVKKALPYWLLAWVYTEAFERVGARFISKLHV
jgi:hypothetical protein